MIDRLQVLVLSVPVKFAGWLVIASLFAIAIDPIIGAVGLAALSAVLAWLSALYWFQRNQAIKERDRIASEHQKLVDRVEQIETQSHVLAQAMLPVTEVFKAILVKQLTHMHTPEMDEALAKLGDAAHPSTLTPQEEDRLAVMLEQRTRDMGDEITPSERDAAAMMPMVIRRARAEAKEAAKAVRLPALKLVVLTAVVEEPNGQRKAMLLHTAPDLPYAITRVEAALNDHDAWERREREVLGAAIAENTRVTREANEAARAVLRQQGHP